MGKNSAGGVWLLVIWIVIIAAALGWVLNIIKLLFLSGPLSEWAVPELVRIIAVPLWPLGCLFGYM